MAAAKRRFKSKKKSPNVDTDLTPLRKVISKDLLAEMEEHWLKGWDSEKLSQHYGQPIEVIEQWIKTDLLNKHRSRYERIAVVFDGLYEAQETARQAYMDDPTNSKSMSYTGIVNSLRGAMLDLDNVQDNQALADEILKLALNPLIRKMSQVLIDELGSFKEELMLKFEEEDADRIANEVAVRAGSHFKTVLDETVQRLEGILGARDKNRRKALQGKTKKHGHLKSVPSV